MTATKRPASVDEMVIWLAERHHFCIGDCGGDANDCGTIRTLAAAKRERAAARAEAFSETLAQWDAYGEHLFRSWLESRTRDAEKEASGE